MSSRSEKLQIICQRLQQLGYQRNQRIRLYGEEFVLISNPVPDGDGFAVEGVTRSSHKTRKMRIPLSLIETLRKEVDLELVDVA
jgi:hypothetical protein